MHKEFRSCSTLTNSRRVESSWRGVLLQLENLIDTINISIVKLLYLLKNIDKFYQNVFHTFTSPRNHWKRQRNNICIIKEDTYSASVNNICDVKSIRERKRL